MQGLAAPLVESGSKKFHGTRVLGLAGGITLELDSGGHHRKPEQYSVGVYTKF